MNRRQLVTVILGVIVFHAALFWLIAGTNPLPKVTPIPRPQFIARETPFVDAKTGEKMIYREFQVSTRLAFPDVLMEKKE